MANSGEELVQTEEDNGNDLLHTKEDNGEIVSKLKELFGEQTVTAFEGTFSYLQFSARTVDKTCYVLRLKLLLFMI